MTYQMPTLKAKGHIQSQDRMALRKYDINIIIVVTLNANQANCT